MKNLLYLLLGFLVAFSVIFNAYAEGFPGGCQWTNCSREWRGWETAGFATAVVDLTGVATTYETSPYGGGKVPPLQRVTCYQYYYDRDTSSWVNNSNVSLALWTKDVTIIGTPTVWTDNAGGEKPQTNNYVCPPPPCTFPNAKNAAGVCVPCPSGVFQVGVDTCMPLCNYARAYIPGEVYNPGDGQGTCIQPPCGSGQITDANGRCQPNCPEGKKINIVTGSCEADCIYGQHDVSGVCVNDCPDGQVRDPETTSCVRAPGCLTGEELVNAVCVPNCLPGEERSRTGQCGPATIRCPAGQNNVNGVCVPSTVACPTGTAWSQEKQKCIATGATQVVNETVTTNPDGTITTVREDRVTVIGNGGSADDPETTPTTGTTTRTETYNPATGDKEVTTNFTPPSVDKYTGPERKLDFTGWNSQVRRMSEEGPVKLLSHVKEIVQWFDVEPETPVFTCTVGGQTFNIDLSPFDGLAEATRFLLSCFMTVGVFWFGFRLFGLL